MNPVVEALEREPLRNIVLLKHLDAYPDHTTLHRVERDGGAATMVLLEVAASAYDLRTYPGARYAALISSDGPDLTRELIEAVPRKEGVVFKLSSDADRDVVALSFPHLQRTTAVLSFTCDPEFVRDDSVRTTMTPSDAVFACFESQKHGRDWLKPLLHTGRAFICVTGPDEQPHAVCFAFENYRRIWEIGGVFTPPEVRGRGYAARVVRTALAELGARRLSPRYQVHDDNIPSIRLAESIGLTRFLETTHFLYTPGAA
ncbi:MAG: GNAT family N-acetyltransferase [Alphaproteobacteria bacterium]|nr:GNAT family N-acetyltransferase [Alphaproteobacteria bacterium]MCW5739753.1 GNAT family N-acetyltransferase [Alphaproteobacteria bacterium]